MLWSSPRCSRWLWRRPAPRSLNGETCDDPPRRDRRGSQVASRALFDTLSDRLQKIFSRAKSHGRLSEKQVDEILREIRIALLEADVNFRVVKNLIGRIRERSVGAEVHQSLTPGQQVIKIVEEELVATLGGEAAKLQYASRPPTVIMMAGLQGSGKTTHAAKLALHMK